MTLDDQSARARFDFLVNAPALFYAVVTALEVELFNYLTDHPGAEPTAIGSAVAIPAPQLRVLLHALCTTGLITRDRMGYRNSAFADDELTGTAAVDWRDTFIGWREIYFPAFRQLTESLRAGSNTALAAYAGTEPTLYSRLAREPDVERVLHASMGAFTRRTLDALLDRSEFANVGTLLDVGGGDGSTAQRLVAQYPELSVTVFDIPSVVALAEEIGPTTGSITFAAGDLFEDSFPGGMDAVLFSHVLEVFLPSEILNLLKKSAAVLPKGGRVFIYGFHASEDETEGFYAARLSLYLNVLATGRGMAYPVSDYVRWLRAAGFDQIEVATGLPCDHGFISGVKL